MIIKILCDKITSVNIKLSGFLGKFGFFDKPRVGQTKRGSEQIQMNIAVLRIGHI